LAACSDFSDERNKWLRSDDSELIKQCVFDEYQASGPGGQKRNRKYSAVRLKHLPTGIEVRSAESRSQKQNRGSALKKLRALIAIEVRSGLSPDLDSLVIGLNNVRYPLFLAKLFDELHSCEFRISEVAENLGVSTGKLVKLMARDSHVWQIVNSERKRRGIGPLKQ
jgi:hypothetical protein